MNLRAENIFYLPECITMFFCLYYSIQLFAVHAKSKIT